jgi:poly(3-hydroxybutyrate) depolymerase
MSSRTLLQPCFVSIASLLLAFPSLRVMADPPRILANRQPQSQCIIVGQSAAFSFTAQGTAPLQYQWRFNGVDLPDKTNASLSIRPVAPANGGDYQVAVRNTEGSVTSLVARLHVLPAPASLQARVYTNAINARLPYRLWVPTNHLKDGPLPLVLFLHGAGERGSDNLAQLTGQPHALSFVSYQNQETHPCFFVAPQCPANSSWIVLTNLESVGGMFSNLLAQYSIDPDRIYVTGLSLGGYGSWLLLAEAPDLFAAAVPICGGLAFDSAYIKKETPIWDFHSADDPTVAVSNSRTNIAALRERGGNPIYTEYASAGHGAWVPAYSTQAMIDWTMAQRRGKPSPCDPLVTIPTAYVDRIARAPVGYFSLHGGATAFGEPITNLLWTNVVMRTGGTAIGSNDWSIPSIALREVETNVIVITAKTTSFSPQYGGTTTMTKTALVRGLPPLQLALWREAPMRLAWTGGEPPYRVQSSPDLTSDMWTDIPTNAVSPIKLEEDQSAAYYRVICP